jgi:hypothetical protein
MSGTTGRRWQRASCRHRCAPAWREQYQLVNAHGGGAAANPSADMLILVTCYAQFHPMKIDSNSSWFFAIRAAPYEQIEYNIP